MALINTKKTALFIGGATQPVYPAGFLEVEAELAINPTIPVEEFNRINGRLGSVDSYADTCKATTSLQISHKMRSSNIAGTALETPPEYGPLLKMCGFDETITGTGATGKVVYTNSQTPAKGSIAAFIDGYKQTATNSAVGDITFDFAVGKAAMLSATISAYLDNSGVAAAAALPSVTLNTNPCVIVGCADIISAGGTAVKADSVKIVMGAQVEDFYGMGIKEFNINDYKIKVTATFYPENADYNAAINKLTAQTVEAISVKLGTNLGLLVDGKSVEFVCALAKASSFTDSVDKATLKREFTWMLQGDSAGKAIEIRHGDLINV